MARTKNLFADTPGKGGPIEVLVIEIPDCGMGIPETDLPFIFDSFPQSQLDRKLKALTEYSAIHHLRSFRIQKSKGLLVDEQLTIASIAYEVGFSDPDYFSKVFRKMEGLPHSDYRAQMLAHRRDGN